MVNSFLYILWLGPLFSKCVPKKPINLPKIITKAFFIVSFRPPLKGGHRTHGERGGEVQERGQGAARPHRRQVLPRVGAGNRGGGGDRGKLVPFGRLWNFCGHLLCGDFWTLFCAGDFGRQIVKAILDAILCGYFGPVVLARWPLTGFFLAKMGLFCPRGHFLVLGQKNGIFVHKITIFFLPKPIFFCRGRRWGRKKKPRARWPLTVLKLSSIFSLYVRPKWELF